MIKAYEVRSIAKSNANKFAINEIEVLLKEAALRGEFSIDYTYSKGSDSRDINETLVKHGFSISHIGSNKIKISFRYNTDNPF